ncbi:MAG: hypothetical protein LUQ50_00770 [Methanospirillum sp.]|uniref:hypothetical protein n=1 Tax=Methanospirillum sp. TaxID=45200 RepID=UPI00236B8358|nr:hypothetical protein [Methanospirillum sp.]MDD1727585.1 hypothetical protein [Methanospirillum sp.]
MKPTPWKTPEDKEIGSVHAKPVFPIYLSASVYDPLQECLKEELRAYFLVPDNISPAFRVFPEKLLKSGEEEVRYIIPERIYGRIYDPCMTVFGAIDIWGKDSEVFHGVNR